MTTASETVIVRGIKRKPSASAKAIWRVIVAGKDVTEKLSPLLLRLSLTEKSGGEADELEIELDDRLGEINLPKTKSLIKVWIGWERGNVPIGLVDKGSFKIDEITYRGPPDRISIRAKSANFTDNLHIRRNHSFNNKTIEAILGEIANRNNYSLAIDNDLKTQIVKNIYKSNSSDGALIKSLGRRFDALASIKNNTIIFTKKGNTQTPKGNKLTSFEIEKTECGTYSYGEVERENHDGAHAEYHDKKTGKRETVHSNPNATKSKKLRRVFHNKTDAENATKATHSRAKQKSIKLDLDLPLGRPDFIPNQTGKVTGLKPTIDARQWKITEITHTMDGDGGLKSRLVLNSK